MTVLLIVLALLVADLAALVRELRTDGYGRRTLPAGPPSDAGLPSRPYALR